jgi:glycerol-3-phosphate O-acyltransferase
MRDPRWPLGDGTRIVFLLETSGGFERGLLQRWIAENRPPATAPASVTSIELSAARRGRQPERTNKELEASLATHDDPSFAPLRVAWLASDRDSGTSISRLSRLLLLGDPHEPGHLRQRWIARMRPERCRVIVAEPARLSDLRRRWQEAGGVDRSETVGLAEFVARQASLALERAERRVRGLRYKVPRFVQESILERPAFRGGIARLAWELGLDTAEVGHRATAALGEIAATHSPYMIDVAAHLAHALYARGYGKQLDYDRRELERIYALAQRHPVVFLPSHKSNLDHLVLLYALYENGHPPNHTAGGDNMNFLPVGPLMRRSGVFFIRRSFKDDRVYKFVLGQYLDYLIEKRFPLEWYIEGGRSRSGKLLPPRFGLLGFVVDAYRRSKSEDVHLVPVSIAYDQIQDVGSYVAEQRGAEKEAEGFRWFLRMVRGLHRRYGRIHIRFGAPLSLRATLGSPQVGSAPNPEEQSIELQKLAFEVAHRINRATPITPTSLVTLALLGAGDRALTLEETAVALGDLLGYVERRSLPMTEALTSEDLDSVRRPLEHLVENSVVVCFRGGPEAVYAIGADQHLAAAYYRNAIIHFFITGAVVELSLLRSSDPEVTDREREFWEESLRIRDLLKFEFFFPDKDAYRDEIRAELELQDASWPEIWSGGAEAIRSLLGRTRPFRAHLVLRPFLEAYRVVGDALERRGAADSTDTAALVDECLGLGRQYHLQRRLQSAESVSKVLFQSAIRLAENRKLLAASDGDVDQRRRAFAAELRHAIRRVDQIDALAASRRAGLIA